MPSTYGEWDKLVKEEERNLRLLRVMQNTYKKYAEKDTDDAAMHHAYTVEYNYFRKQVENMESQLEKNKKKRDDAPPGTTAVGGSRRKRTRANRKKNKRTRKY